MVRQSLDSLLFSVHTSWFTVDRSVVVTNSDNPEILSVTWVYSPGEYFIAPVDQSTRLAVGGLAVIVLVVKLSQIPGKKQGDTRLPLLMNVKLS